MKVWLGRIISLAALGYVGYFIFSSVQQVVWSDIHLNWFFLFFSFIFGLGYYLIRNFAWMRLIRARHFSISYIGASHFFSSSEMLRYIPGNVWGLGARVLKGPAYGIPKEHAALLLIEETALLLSSVSVLSGILILCVPNIDLLWKLLGVVLIISFSLFFTLPFFVKKFMKVISKFFSFILSASEISVPSLFKVFPLYIILWCCYGLSNALLFQSIFSQNTGTFLLVFVFSLLAWFIGYASLITPSGLGVRELILSIGLAERVTVSFASLFSLLSRIWLTVLELLFFIFVVLCYKKLMREEAIHERLLK